MEPDVFHTVEVLLLIFLFSCQVYFLGKLFSYSDPELLSRYRFLGPFAFAVPGVLKPGGTKFLLATLFTFAALFAFSLYFFELSYS